MWLQKYKKFLYLFKIKGINFYPLLLFKLRTKVLNHVSGETSA